METAKQHSSTFGEVSPGYSMGTQGTPGVLRGRGGERCCCGRIHASRLALGCGLAKWRAVPLVVSATGCVHPVAAHELFVVLFMFYPFYFFSQSTDE